MPIEIRVDHNIKDVLRGLNEIQRKQIPFVTAKSLTRTAQEIQKREITNIQKVFQNRRKWYTKTSPIGVRIVPATKLKLRAGVYTNAHFADLQEVGGTKYPKGGGGILIPGRDLAKRLRFAGKHNQVFNHPKTVTHDGNPFTKTGGRVFVFQRRTKKPYPLKLMYTVKRSAHINERMNFIRTGARVAGSIFESQFRSNLARELSRMR